MTYPNKKRLIIASIILGEIIVLGILKIARLSQFVISLFGFLYVWVILLSFTALYAKEKLQNRRAQLFLLIVFLVSFTVMVLVAY